MAAQTPRQKCSFSLSEDVWKALRIHSAISGQEMSALVELGLRQVLPRDAFRVATHYASQPVASQAPAVIMPPEPRPMKPIQEHPTTALLDKLLALPCSRVELADALSHSPLRPEDRTVSANYLNQWRALRRIPDAWVPAVEKHVIQTSGGVSPASTRPPLVL